MTERQRFGWVVQLGGWLMLLSFMLIVKQDITQLTRMWRVLTEDAAQMLQHSQRLEELSQTIYELSQTIDKTTSYLKQDISLIISREVQQIIQKN